MAAVGDLVAAGVLRPGKPRACCRLAPVPKCEDSTRFIYVLRLWRDGGVRTLLIVH